MWLRYFRNAFSNGSNFPVLPEDRPFGDSGSRHSRKGLEYSIRAAGKKYHKLGGLKQKKIYSLTALEAKKSEIKVSAKPSSL